MDLNSPTPLHRQAVYTTIDAERDYQDQKWGVVHLEGGHEVGAWILIMESLLADARKAWQSVTGNRDALDEIRKVVAVGVACMEQHGTPSRSDEQARKKERAYLASEIRK